MASWASRPLAVTVIAEPMPGREHHQPHDRLAARAFALVRHGDLRVEALHQLDEFRRGARVQALLVDDLEDAGDGAR